MVPSMKPYTAIPKADVGGQFVLRLLDQHGRGEGGGLGRFLSGQREPLLDPDECRFENALGRQKIKPGAVSDGLQLHRGVVDGDTQVGEHPAQQANQLGTTLVGLF